MTNLEAALWYSQIANWPVLPLHPGSKLPACTHGITEATTDEAQIRAWWRHHPDRNVGVACGAASGIVVVDIDPRNGGGESYEAWCEAHGKLGEGPMALTAGGGAHMICAHETWMRSTKLGPGIDFLSDGRYFVAAPSVVGGVAYAWELSCDPREGVAPALYPPTWRDVAPPRAPRAADGITPGLIVGARNEGLAAIAGALRRYGLSEAEILAAIQVANETRCDVPLPASEVAQIARSVARYEPESDVGANAAVGGAAADRLVANYEREQSALRPPRDYFLTRATELISQPAPLEWLAKGWVPASGSTMIFGESGAGKTFLAIDLACSIAAGRSWCGVKTKPGIVVFLAGEGNYGIRQRIAAWCKLHGVSALDNLLVSNKAIDLDRDDSAAQIISAVRELTTEKVSANFVDTVNNHFSGDENSARDARKFLNCANLVSAAVGGALVYVHHTGHGEGAKTRARGSSAFRGALDSSIFVKKTDDDGIQVECDKMKDAERPEPFCGALTRVPLEWLDEDQAPIAGAAFQKTAAPPQKASKEPKRVKAPAWEKWRRLFEGAWIISGRERRDGAPYVSRSALRAHLESPEGGRNSPSTSDQHTYPSGRMIAPLLAAQHLVAHDAGWCVTGDVGIGLYHDD